MIKSTFRILKTSRRFIHIFEQPNFIKFSQLKDKEFFESIENIGDKSEKLALLGYQYQKSNQSQEGYTHYLKWIQSSQAIDFKNLIIGELNVLELSDIVSIINIYGLSLKQTDFDQIIKRLNELIEKSQKKDYREISLILQSLNIIEKA